ncbi:ABC transporter permease [Neosynechococcus sphagnicola]|uniref:ABC transporter permease n=1 Tax=Neosynechococcus sphagnicola TaxID=1501145 RepID=UPI000A4102F2|nr:ABC transporter permease [Neosynechococcus sphagnicola]
MILSLKSEKNWAQAQRYWELLQVLIARQLKVRYRGSLLGVYWSLLNPLLMTGLYTAIFGAAFKSYYGDSVLNYVLAVFTGLVVIKFFLGFHNPSPAKHCRQWGALEQDQYPDQHFSCLDGGG